MNKGWMKLLCICLCLGLVLTACGGDTTKPLVDQAVPSGAEATPGAEASDAPVDYAKYNAYLELADVMSEIEEVLVVYFNNVEYQSGFALVDGGDYANIKDAVEFYTALSYVPQKALDYAGKEPAYPEADAAVLALGDSVERVMDALGHLGSYMRFDDYVDDNMARAGALHAELWSALETYDANYPVFLATVEDLAQAGEDDALDALRSSGQNILYNSRLMIRISQDIQGEITEQMAAAAGDIGEEDVFTLPTLDMTNLSPMFAQLQTVYQDLTAALESEEEQAKVFSGKLGDSAVKLYTSRVNSLYADMESLAQAVMEGNEYGEAYGAVSEAVDNLIDAYDSVI